ncbi:hypothetical protein GUITHDRAFT_99627 [Guillardia theta CCMP2712]|uniref:Cyclic nucleotide-binding domain-containing protein n=1 Tax=Guillardia theta (strain CCMP2712) TaxID=905079 RepID=L1K2C8_GUITC|nr:hypothetical protein GUITHDRAFT_99627 [Guillardia theta CCMP2712]EKX54981.1 hypothetical protein GUITHDRAFT_99627 [Guillardia theta CCMP2712]|eukprot:XP_005841961.1 hypothetical protein GUITHDRAFT_99627 [Guillardia theta CCMP2712]
MIKVLHQKFPKSTFVVTSLELLLTMVLFAHWTSCLWFVVGYPNGWVTLQNIVTDGERVPNQRFYEWISSFYWAVTTMTTIGYGDISAHTANERAISVVVMVMGCAFLAWVTGRITRILTQKSGCISKFEGKLEELNEYDSRILAWISLTRTPGLWMLEAFPKDSATRYGLSNILSAANAISELILVYCLLTQMQRIFDENEILNDLEGDIRKETTLELYRDIVSKVPLFNLCSTATQREVCYRLGHLYKTKGTKIFDENESSNEIFLFQLSRAIYIVRFGVVSIRSKKKEIMRAQRGDLVGEAGILGLTPNESYGFTAIAETMCELCVLDVKDFQEMLVHNPDFFRVIERVLYYHVIQLENRVQCHDMIDRSDKWMIKWDAIARAFNTESPEFKCCAGEKDAVEDDSLLLATQFHFQLRLVQGEGLIPGKLFFFRLEFKSDSDMATSTVADGPIFDLHDEVVNSETYEISQTIRMLLKHAHNDWDRFPDLKISIHQIRVQNSHFGRSFSKGIHLDSFEYAMKANSMEIWQGEICWKVMIDNRCASLDQCEDQQMMGVTLKPTGLQELAPCKLWFTTNASRLLRHNSRWRQILDILRKTSASPYFAQKQIDSLIALRERIEEKLRQLRIQRMEYGNTDVFKALKGWALPCINKSSQGYPADSPRGDEKRAMTNNVSTNCDDRIEEMRKDMQAMSRSIYILCEEISSLKKAVVGKGGRTNGQRSNSFAYSSAQDTARTTAMGRIPLDREEGEERRREVSSVMIAATEPITGGVKFSYRNSQASGRETP